MQIYIEHKYEVTKHCGLQGISIYHTFNEASYPFPLRFIRSPQPLTWHSCTWQLFLFHKSKLAYVYILTILMGKPHFLSTKAIKNSLSFKFEKKRSSWNKEGKWINKATYNLHLQYTVSLSLPWLFTHPLWISLNCH